MDLALMGKEIRNKSEVRMKNRLGAGAIKRGGVLDKDYGGEAL
jgi:hypothetical protein